MQLYAKGYFRFITKRGEETAYYKPYSFVHAMHKTDCASTVPLPCTTVTTKNKSWFELKDSTTQNVEASFPCSRHMTSNDKPSELYQLLTSAKNISSETITSIQICSEPV